MNQKKIQNELLGSISKAIAVGSLFLSFGVQAVETTEYTFPEMRPVANASEWKPHIGIIAGAAQAEGTSVSSSELGIDVGYQPYIPFGLAAEYSYSHVDDGTESKDRNTVWAKGTYNFGGQTMIIKDSYIGIGLGAVLKSDGTSYAAAPIIGFDIPIQVENKIISVGATSRYAVVSDNDADTFSLSGVVKYWY